MTLQWLFKNSISIYLVKLKVDLKNIQRARGLSEPDSASRFYLDVINKQSCQENEKIQNTLESEGKP